MPPERVPGRTGAPEPLEAAPFAWPGILARLAAGHDLTVAEARAALGVVFEGEATAAQLAAFIFGLRCKGETVEEMTGMVEAMLAAATPVPVPAQLRTRLVDTCGTGGDRSGTINVSTIAALVVAGAGVPVCKHGGRAASSQAGSADVLEALGVAIDLGPEGVLRCIEEAGIGFCFAPRYHPAMRHAVPVRREIGVPTAFNFLGPLANPARVTRQMVGVGDPAMAERMCHVLVAGGAVNVAVVYGSDGLDELTTTGPSTLVRWEAGNEGRGGPVTPVTTVVDPRALGLAPAEPADLKGGDAPVNAAHARRVLEGKRGPHRDIVLLNAAAALLVGGRARDLAEGLEVAAGSIDAGSALVALERLISTSQLARNA
ncbi:MAG: anthranilate phosphoribosyltransferase [Acidimicrobiaceae bacterium]|nr:anthranilate phosphoribosyltransferase [Acidimicrobiaceae bacterium]MBO0747795.1 anthranilate phosphoribosyltransferase [Acidimicrobiaceae bacterium]